MSQPSGNALRKFISQRIYSLTYWPNEYFGSSLPWPGSRRHVSSGLSLFSI
ncbi:hypothetical protein CBOM_02009 [Ceraceosorus bombacis]|uniref:Uncharacterized protein n=1 Tax=Ceraceosorus bombacis TaxID=401625 RepID=A0A0P1BF87_9BASI|nr:hypothetical protein CBOM_02009 [Ceraceosorus bombacis]